MTGVTYVKMFCCLCAKKATQKRSIDPISKTCSDCQKSAANTNASASATDTPDRRPSIDDDAMLSSVTFSEYKTWMQSQLSPIHNDIKILKENAEEIGRHADAIELLKQRCDRNEEVIESLKGVIAKQQKTIRNQDAEIREKNLIITGIAETDLSDTNGTYTNDAEKVSALFDQLGVAAPTGFTVERLGKPNDRYSRSMKVNVLSKTNRTEIAKKSRDLKKCSAPWNKVYINYDLHPGDVEESKRLRKKKKLLLSIDENKTKDIKIEKGKLTMDGVVVDSNILFQ